MGLSIGDFVNLVKGTIGFNLRSIDFIQKTFRRDLDWDDVEQWTRDVNKLLGIVDEASEELQLIVAISTAFAVSDIITAARAGPIADIMETKAMTAVSNFVAPIATVYDRLKKEESRIKGILDNETIQQSLATIRIGHRIALVVSNDYRREYADLQDSIRNVALSVFGEVSTINSALALLQMGVHDITALRGEAVDIGNNEFIGESIRLTKDIEKHSIRYAQYPGQFWLDFQNNYLGPLNERKTLINREKDSRVDRAIDFLDEVDRGVDAVDKRIGDYIRVSEAILPEDTSRELRDWVRDWDRNYGHKLKDINKIIGEDIPEIETKILAIDEAIQKDDDKLAEIAEIVNDPALNDEATRRAQRARFRAILESAWTIHPDSTALANDAQRSLEAELTEDTR